MINLYFNLSTFGEDQVNAAMGATGALFNDALIVTVQDRTSDDAPITWPAEVDQAVRGLIKGFVPDSGLFDDVAPAPAITFGAAGITAELAAGSPQKEDPTLPEHLPQRYTYSYNIRFQPGFTGFNSIPGGGFQDLTVTVSTYDRSNNQRSQPGSIRLLRDANPYMSDGDPAWLSIDIRVFRVFEGDTKFNATLAGGSPNPNTFIQAVINNLRNNNAGGDTFDNLPTASDQSALVFFPTVTDRTTGATRRVFNFALAKVRLRGTNGASNVRAFFRLFRYTAGNLIFNDATGYRTHNQGGANKILLMGFDNVVAGENANSVPFFAAPRVNYDVGMQTQSDPLNVQNFPAGNPNGQAIYFGVYLDINQDVPNSRLPATYISALAEQNWFGVGEVTSVKNIFYDSHVCMAVEINHDGDPTTNGVDPFTSDNLAPRNLVVLKSDNPGGPITHQVQHSFEVFTGDRYKQFRRDEDRQPQDDVSVVHPDHDQQHPALPAADSSSSSTCFVVTKTGLNSPSAAGMHAFQAHAITPRTNRLRSTISTRWRRPSGNNIRLSYSAEWSDRNDLFDELLIRWNDLPKEARATIHFPGINCEQIIKLRHAPGDVRIRDSHTLELAVGGVTYLPVPAGQNARIPALIPILRLANHATPLPLKEWFSPWYSFSSLARWSSDCRQEVSAVSQGFYTHSKRRDNGGHSWRGAGPYQPS